MPRHRRPASRGFASTEIPRRGRVWPKGLMRLMLGLLGLVPALGFLGFGVLWLTVPPDHQTPRIPGLTAPVDITIDGNGVPRIKAANERDAAAAMGFMHARDRLFQMELMRRTASGRLSELAGAATLPIDKYMRILGVARLAGGDLDAQTPETRALLEAYTAGVNAWINERGRFAAMEFLVYGRPEPWRPTDSLLWGRTMGLWLSSNYRTELSRHGLTGKVPPEVIRALWPAWPAPPRPEASLSGGTETARRLLATLPAFPAPFTLPASASNAWAVDGRRSVTGAPLLAGDPHLGFGFPGLWYLARIETPDGVLAGATAPGVPFVIFGHNGRIAWTFTTAGVDTQDVYLEPPEAKYSSRVERITVRGQDDVLLTVRETRHGPVLSDQIGPGQNGMALAIAMANLRPRDTGASGLLALNHAHTVEEAGLASALIVAPVQNLITADRDKIALYTTGQVPIRRRGDGWGPVPGIAATPVTRDGAGLDAEEDAFGWSGFASGEALPRVVAPASGRLINANEPVAPADFPVFMGGDMFRDWRARRIRALLDERTKFSASDFAAMQSDVISMEAMAILPRLRGVPGASQVLRDWDGAMIESAPQPLVFNAWMDAFHRAILARANVPASAAAPWFDLLPHVLSPEGSQLCGGDCGPLLKSTFDSTMSSLAARFGQDPSLWRWGSVHQAVFGHPFLQNIPVIGALTTFRIPVPGDHGTINRGGTDETLASVHGASFRGVYDLADLDRSLFIAAPGQSGHPLSRHARDFLTRWRDGALVLLGPKPATITGDIRLLP